MIKSGSIEINDRGFTGFLVVPENANGAGILLLQEIFGVNDHIRDVSRFWGELGYTVLTPDIFWRIQPGIELSYDEELFDKGRDLKARTEIPLAVEDLKQALEKLRGQPTCRGKVAAMGFCMGGTFAYVLAAESDIAAAVCYYGSNIDDHLEYAEKLHVPVLMHWGADDVRLTPDKVDNVRRAVKEKDVTMVVYKAGHGFNRDPDPKFYDRHSAMQALARTAVFLDRWLLR